MTSDQIGSICGLGALTTVAQTKNPSLFGKAITLSSGTPIVVDSSGNIQRDLPWYCAGSNMIPGPFMFLSNAGCGLSMSDTAEIGSYTDIGAAMSPANVATVTQQIAQTYQEQCALNPESCAIARSTIPIVPAIEATTAGIISPVICGPFSTPTLQPDGSYKCHFDPTNIPSWLLVVGAAVGALVLFRGL